MDSEEKFWLVVWSLVAAVVVTIALCLTITAANTTNKVAEAVKAGVDPLAAKCALDMPAESSKILCAYLKE